MKYASTFLSHNSTNKSLVESVAHELGRRGIIAWLDKNDFVAGESMDKALEEAIARQTTFTVFLSEQALKSSWVRDELAIALEKEEMLGKEIIVPVFLGDPYKLVSSHSLLRSRWLHDDGIRVTRLGIGSSDVVNIADELARRVYTTLEIPSQRRVIIYLDQRGTAGRRFGEPQGIPENLSNLDAPALVFRPDLDFRSDHETLYGDEWRTLCSTMQSALSTALGNLAGPDPREIHIVGNAQLAFFFFLGFRLFNRSTSAHLFCHNARYGTIFNNKNQECRTPLTGGNPLCESTHKQIAPIIPEESLGAVALILVSQEKYLLDALDYMKARHMKARSIWIKHENFDSNDQVMSYVENVVALLLRIHIENGVRRVYLFCGLPDNVFPLLAANLGHVMDNVVFMEYRKDLQGKEASAEEMYTPLSM